MRRTSTNVVVIVIVWPFSLDEQLVTPKFSDRGEMPYTRKTPASERAEVGFGSNVAVESAASPSDIDNTSLILQR